RMYLHGVAAPEMEGRELEDVAARVSQAPAREVDAFGPGVGDLDPLGVEALVRSVVGARRVVVDLPDLDHRRGVRRESENEDKDEREGYCLPHGGLLLTRS